MWQELYNFGNALGLSYAALCLDPKIVSTDKRDCSLEVRRSNAHLRACSRYLLSPRNGTALIFSSAIYVEIRFCFRARIALRNVLLRKVLNAIQREQLP